MRYAVNKYGDKKKVTIHRGNTMLLKVSIKNFSLKSNLNNVDYKVALHVLCMLLHCEYKTKS